MDNGFGFPWGDAPIPDMLAHLQRLASMLLRVVATLANELQRNPALFEGTSLEGLWRVQLSTLLEALQGFINQQWEAEVARREALEMGTFALSSPLAAMNKHKE